MTGQDSTVCISVMRTGCHGHACMHMMPPSGGGCTYAGCASHAELDHAHASRTVQPWISGHVQASCFMQPTRTDNRAVHMLPQRHLSLSLSTTLSCCAYAEGQYHLQRPQPLYLHWPCVSPDPCCSAPADTLAPSSDPAAAAAAAVAVVLLCGPACTSTVLGCGLGAGSSLGSVTVRTPLSRLALMSSSLTLSGSAKVREKEMLLFC
jgi:hypothetical protein